MGKLRSMGRAAWYVYSLLCIFFIGVIVVDLLLIWGLGFQHGIILYVNNFGEGFSEQLEFLSMVPWIVVTAIRTVEDAARFEKPKIRLTKEEWAVFRQWLSQTQAARENRERRASDLKEQMKSLQDELDDLETKH